MSGIAGAINTALTGLELYEAGISTVSNNLANSATSGYTVENVNAQTLVGSPGQPGIGVEAAQIVRATSGFAATQLRNANSASTAAAAQSTSLTAISNALTNNGNVETSINSFFQDISSLASNPTSTAQRQTVLADAQTVTSSFQTAASVMNQTITGAQTSLSTDATSANNLLAQLNNINQSLIKAPNQPSLLDQQESALNALSQLLPASTIAQPDGGVIVATGGTILLDQSGAQALSVTTTASGAPQVTAGTNATAVTLTEADGSLGAALGTISSGTAALQALGTLAAIFATNVNTAQNEGLDQTGAQGGALFNVPSPSVTPATANTGSAVITASIANAASLPTDGGPFTLSYSSSNGWSATDQASGQSYTVSGTPPTFAGLALAISGTAANGDSFTVNPAPAAATGISVATSNTSAIAAADPYVSSLGTLQADGSTSDTNAGTINFGSDSVTSTPSGAAAIVPATYFGQNLQLNFTSSTSYTVTTSADPNTVIASGTLGSNGGVVAVAYPSGLAAGQYWQLPISGSPAAGDTATLSPGGTSSGSNAQRMAAMWTASGTTTAGTLEQSFIGLSTGLGANAQAATQLSTAATAQVTTATANLNNVAGVNSDQQAVLLTTYQQAYQAAAQAISAARTMFDSLLSAI